PAGSSHRPSSIPLPTTTAPIRSAAPRRPWRSAARSSSRDRQCQRRPALMDNSFVSGYLVPFVITVVEILVIVVPLLIAVAYLTYAERKVRAAAQLRMGPNVVGPFGLWQPFADGFKLLMKETVIPSSANRMVFIAAPILTFVLSLVAWAVIPISAQVVLANINV